MFQVGRPRRCDTSLGSSIERCVREISQPSFDNHILWKRSTENPTRTGISRNARRDTLWSTIALTKQLEFLQVVAKTSHTIQPSSLPFLSRKKRKGETNWMSNKYLFQKFSTVKDGYGPISLACLTTIKKALLTWRHVK